LLCDNCQVDDRITVNDVQKASDEQAFGRRVAGYTNVAPHVRLVRGEQNDSCVAAKDLNFVRNKAHSLDVFFYELVSSNAKYHKVPKTQLAS